MPLSSLTIASQLRIIILIQALLFLPSTYAFTLFPINTRFTTARSLGVHLEIDSVIDTLATTTLLVSAAKVTAASTTAGPPTAVVTSTLSGSTVVPNFFAGSAILVGVVGIFKWNGPENSDLIREYWSKTFESTAVETETVETKTPKPSTDEIEPAVPVLLEATAVTTQQVTTTATRSIINKVIPSAKDASSPQDLITMMKDVGDATTPKKKRSVIRLLKKIVMPWRKWKNL